MKNAVLIYDDRCDICSASIRFLIKYIDKSKVEVVGLFSSSGRELDRIYGLSKYDSVIFINNDNLYIESDAIVESVRYSKFPINLLQLIKYIPKFFRNPVYRFIAKNRHKISFSQNNCRLDNKK